MKKKLMLDVESIGDLYLDSVFFEFEMEPLLFTCKDVKDNLYFGHCYKISSEQKWFIVPINEKELKDLKEQKSNIRKTLLSSPKIYNVLLNNEGKYSTTNYIDIADLPSENVYLRMIM
jgi:hypothetical protein